MQEIYKFGEIQVDVEMINNQPMFELYSTGMALGHIKWNGEHTHTSPRKERIDKDMISAEIKAFVHNGRQYLTESQLYDLMLEMKTDKVKPFRKWITSEVLPQIRQTGGYVQENRESEFIDKYFPSFTEDTKLSMVQDLRKQNHQFKQRIGELEAETQAMKDLMQAEGYLKMIDVCGVVDKGRNKLFEFLRTQKVITKQSTYNAPYGRFKENGMFKTVTSKDEHGHFSTVTLVSPKGLLYIYKLLGKNELLNEFNSSYLIENGVR